MMYQHQQNPIIHENYSSTLVATKCTDRSVMFLFGLENLDFAKWVKDLTDAACGDYSVLLWI